ncbi:hypothetical protein Kpol_1072p18 [Vanderwaltozyma polyspora DSM 70294]|uniref:Folylpolyglutamate synthase n=1 Tax=Vanderwaltozyma polyspora (strain ATCC 22028 / DSM 70294 / BCRC 21397 / CBS 2163 / NBRC 10782 / NRRL Y-8283 / UCD 57-17) TaxID=436907 RepID=A7TKN6_VANPO|nr:uncharacterized protein Kpol_1072p18 [Vanderwaltozyma polyspora DSM 70294]EDO17148.1 hypothetical protein Kpol_1072p18 [Vanderwaltozyma polyspora DSM 70294]
MKAARILMMTSKTYHDAITKLNTLQSNAATILATRQSGNTKNKMNILEMKEWVRRIGYSISDIDKLNIIHITGTKGKGSTAAFTSSILNEYKDSIGKIGLYTSPHLKSVRERIRINGIPISEEKFTKYFFEVWDKLENTSSSLADFPHMTSGAKPAYFKYLTLLSFHIFLKESCNSCVYEVGVGGEFDSTNVVENPVTCGVSLLGIDHTFMLGNTIEEIAWNKSGIFKKGAPAYTVSNQPTNGLKVLRERAIERETNLVEISPFKQLKEVKLGIDGKFQISNASLAVTLASQFLYTKNISTIDPITDDSSIIPEKIVNGLINTKWEGRCQTLKKGNLTWYLDGAHTKDSIVAASGWFKDITENSKCKNILLFNQQTRDAKALINDVHKVLYPNVTFDEVIFTTNVTWSNSGYSADLVSINTSKDEVESLHVQKALKEEWHSFDKNANISVIHDIESSCKYIESISKAQNVNIFVTGSLHLIGGLLTVFDGK